MAKLPTKERLAQALHAVGLFDLEKRARTGEFSDFEGPHAMPKVELARELGKYNTAPQDTLVRKLRQRVMDGDFDDTKEEGEAWANNLRHRSKPQQNLQTGTFEVRNEEVERKLKEIGNMLREIMPKGWGFTLLISSYGEGGSMFYMSSVERQDAVNMLREFIQKAEPNLK